MHEEQFLISCGCPLEDAVTLCRSLRKERRLDEYIKEAKRPTEHVCKCGERCEHCTCGLR